MWGDGSHPGDILASRAPWPPASWQVSLPSRNSANRIALLVFRSPQWAFRKHAVLFCSNCNLNYPGMSATTQLAGMEVKHDSSYICTMERTTLERTQEKCLIMVKLFSSFEFFAVVKQVLLLWGLCFAAR